MRFFLGLVVAICGLLASAQQKMASQPISAGGRFVDVTAALGIHFRYLSSHVSKHYLPESMGAGVALFDYDNDGRLDIFLVNGAPLNGPTPKGTIPQKSGPSDWNRLYHQKADGAFEDVTERAGLQGAGYGMGVAVGDYDNNGYEDLYVTALGWQQALPQQRQRHLYRCHRECGEHKEGYRSYCHPDYFQPIAPLVYHNDGNGHFTEVSQKIASRNPARA